MNRERWHNTTLNPSDSLMLTHLRRVPCFWVACFVQPATSDSLLRPPYLYVVEALDASVPPKKLFPVFNKELLTVLLIRIFYDLDQSSLPPTIIKSSRKTQICVWMSWMLIRRKVKLNQVPLTYWKSVSERERDPDLVKPLRDYSARETSEEQRDIFSPLWIPPIVALDSPYFGATLRVTGSGDIQGMMFRIVWPHFWLRRGWLILQSFAHSWRNSWQIRWVISLKRMKRAVSRSL